MVTKGLNLTDAALFLSAAGPPLMGSRDSSLDSPEMGLSVGTEKVNINCEIKG